MLRRLLRPLLCLLLVLTLSACQFPFPLLPAGTDSAAELPTQTTSPTAASTDTKPQYVQVWREGESSMIPVQIITGQAGAYTVAMDPAYFTFHPLADGDLYAYEQWQPEGSVYYRICKYDGAFDVPAFLTGGVPAGYQLTEAGDTTLASYPASEMVLIGTGDNAGYYLHKYLLNCGECCYLIECRFVFEMYEGLFAVMRACLETFQAS